MKKELENIVRIKKLDKKYIKEVTHNEYVKGNMNKANLYTYENNNVVSKFYMNKLSLLMRDIARGYNIKYMYDKRYDVYYTELTINKK